MSTHHSNVELGHLPPIPLTPGPPPSFLRPEQSSLDSFLLPQVTGCVSEQRKRLSAGTGASLSRESDGIGRRLRATSCSASLGAKHSLGSLDLWFFPGPLGEASHSWAQLCPELVVWCVPSTPVCVWVWRGECHPPLLTSRAHRERKPPHPEPATRSLPSPARPGALCWGFPRRRCVIYSPSSPSGARGCR